MSFFPIISMQRTNKYSLDSTYQCKEQANVSLIHNISGRRANQSVISPHQINAKNKKYVIITHHVTVTNNQKCH